MWFQEEFGSIISLCQPDGEKVPADAVAPADAMTDSLENSPEGFT